MFNGRQKIIKAGGAEPDEFEAQVAQELFNLEVKFNNLFILNFILIIYVFYRCQLQS